MSLLHRGLPYKTAAVPQHAERNVAHNGPVLAPIKLCFLCPPQRGSEQAGLGPGPTDPPTEPPWLPAALGSGSGEEEPSVGLLLLSPSPRADIPITD